MIIFNVHNSYTHFECDTDVEREIVYEALKYEIKNTYGLRKQLEKKHRGNKQALYAELNKLKYKYLVEQGKFFLTGLLSRVCNALEKNNIPYNINDIRTHKKIQPKDIKLNGINLYWYQKQIVQDLLDKKRVILAVGTGGGKTISAIYATLSLDVKTLFITHKLDLLYQTYKNYQKYTKKRVGIIGDGKMEDGEIVIATTGTLYNMIKNDPEYALEFFKDFEMLIIDEAHRASSTSFTAIAKYCVNAVYRLGLTATPFMKSEEENFLLEGVISDYKLEVTPQHLVDENVLAKPYFVYYPIKGEIYKTEWDEIYTDGIVENEERNNIICGVAINRIKKGDKVLIIVLRIDHGEILYDMMKDLCNVEWVKGEDKAQDRQKVIGKMLKGDIDCIIATNIFDEGIDINNINCVILGAGTKSAPALFQRAGRGMRKKALNKCLIVDFIDYQHKILLRHSTQRYSFIKNKDGYTILKNIEEYDKIKE